MCLKIVTFVHCVILCTPYLSFLTEGLFLLQIEMILMFIRSSRLRSNGMSYQESRTREVHTLIFTFYSFDIYLLLAFVCVSVLSINVSMPYLYAVPTGAKRKHWIPRTLS